jgi:tetratricopeptide (TPR) repeat protein
VSFVARAYDARGLPRLKEAGILCGNAGADRYLLGSFEPKESPDEGGGTITFYVGTPGGKAPRAFSAGIVGDGSLPEVAAFAAARACAGRPGASDLKVPAGFLPPFSRTLKILREGDPTSAMSEAMKLAEAYPDSADACYLAGLASMEEKNPYAALRAFTRARNLDPEFSLPAYQEGQVWLSLGRTTLAESAFDQAARAQPSFFEALLEAGILRAKRGDFAAASDKLRRALKLRRDDERARYWMAFCLIGQGKEADGRLILERLVAESPGYGPGRFMLGKLDYGEGDFASAERELRAAVRLLPGDAEAHTLLGEALSRQGKHAEAAREFRRALELEEKKK